MELRYFPGFPCGTGGGEDKGLLPGRKGRLEEGMAAHPVFSPVECLRQEGPGGLQAIGLQGVGHD